MTTCLRHIDVPDLKRCKTCRKEYEEVILRWHGEKAVEEFRTELQKELILEELRK